MLEIIISHNLDFVTFLMNEYNIEIDLEVCAIYKNLESFLVYFDQTNDINKCFVYSVIFNISSLIQYFISHGASINEKNKDGYTALHIATDNNYKEIVKLLISHGANIDEKTNNRETALHVAARFYKKETIKLLTSYMNKYSYRRLIISSFLIWSVTSLDVCPTLSTPLKSMSP